MNVHGFRTWLKSRTNQILLGFLAVAGFFLAMEHKAHLLAYWPYLLLLLCPLMHLFMHGGHHGSHSGHGDTPRENDR